MKKELSDDYDISGLNMLDIENDISCFKILGINSILIFNCLFINCFPVIHQANIGRIFIIFFFGYS